jgi:alpha-1,2-mannosyltransferase
VCVGAEWHRFPSAFFLPEPYRLAFVRSGFSGLLPRQFDPAQGGTRGASPHFNDRNRQDPANFWPAAANCSYAVTLREGGRLIDDVLGGNGIGREGVMGGCFACMLFVQL